MRRMDFFMLWLAHRLPKRLKYWVLIDCGAKATTGEYGNTVVPDLTMMEMIKRNEVKIS